MLHGVISMRKMKAKLTDESFLVYGCIAEGHENARTSFVLSVASGINERTVRKHIEILNCNGLAVCNREDGLGYFKPTSPEDIQASINLTNSRILALTRKKYGLCKALKKLVRDLALEDEITNPEKK